MSENTFIAANLAIESLLKFKTPEAMTAIINWSIMALQDESRPPLNRERAANYLMRFGDERCEALMITMVDDEVVQARRLAAGQSENHAIETLKRLGTPAALSVIKDWQARQDPNS